MHSSDAQSVHGEERAFAAQVLKHAPADLTIDALLTAIREFCATGHVLLADVADCVMRAGAVRPDAVQVAAVAPVVKRKTAALPETSAGRITGRHRVDLLDPWVKAQRTRLFGTPERPFKTAKAMDEWLHSEMAKGQPARTAQGWPKKLDYRDLQMDDMAWIGTPDGPLFPASYLSEEAEQDRSGDQQRSGASVCVVAGSLAEGLADATREMALASGFSQAQLVPLVLCGASPRLRQPRVVVQYRTPHPALTVGTRPPSRPLYSRRIVLEVEEHDFSLKKVEELYARARQLLGSKKAKQFDDKDELLQRIVAKLGGPPPRRYTLAFWKKAAAEWKRQTGTREEPATLRMRYVRLQRALGEPSRRVRPRRSAD